MNTEQYKRPKDASVYLGIGLSTFWKYVKNGHIKVSKLSYRVTVVSIDELEAFVERGVRL